MGIISTRERGREGRREVLLNEEARVSASCQKNIKQCRAVLHTRYQVWRTGDEGRWVDRKRLDKGRDRAVGFLILIEKGSLF